MNIKEGLRRTGLVAGILGGCAGLLVFAKEAERLEASQSNANEFAALQASTTVKDEIAALKGIGKDDSQGTKNRKNLGTAEGKAPWTIYQKKDQPNLFDAIEALGGSRTGWSVNKDGIKTLYFNEGNLIGIRKTDGIRLSANENPPSLADWAMLLLFPTVGFMLPWLILRMITWAVLGFHATT